MIKKTGILLSVLVMVIGFSVSAHAALVDMADGTIYDSDTQLSWLKDAGAGGVKNLTDANAWAASLNIGALTGWRLPNVDPVCNGGAAGYNCANGEMGHMYYTVLGNAAGGPLTKTGPFINIQANAYWSGTVFSADPINNAWAFSFSDGLQGQTGSQTSLFNAWAVRPGARTVTPSNSSMAVGYNSQWLIATMTILLLAGGYLLQRMQRTDSGK